ncbi:nucleotide-binding protein [Legionella pneumophila serogroup 1]
MNNKFEGSYQDIQDKVLQIGIEGIWKELSNGQKQYKTNDNAILNWWETSKTISFQGPETAKKRLESAFFESSSVINKSKEISNKPDSKTKIFIVHGHDQTSLEQLELVLRRLSLDPYILQNNDGESKTLVEALEKQIYTEAAFGIVLMTPDDYGYSKEKGDEQRQPRARQNVILELGMVMASLGRERTVILKKGNLELPSDVNGMIYLEFNEHVKEIAVKLANRMKGAGIEIQENLIAQASV